MKLYERLAADIEGQVLRGVLRHGDRIPSVRQIVVLNDGGPLPTPCTFAR